MKRWINDKITCFDHSPYAASVFFRKSVNSAIAAIFALTTSLYFKAKWFAAVANCNASSLQKETIEAKI